MKRFLFLLYIFLFAACQSTPAPGSSATIGVQNPASYNPTPNTATSITDQRLLPAASASPLSPESFNPAAVGTFTPAPAPACPESTNLEFDYNALLAQNPNEDTTEYILDFLNSGGSMQAIVAGYQNFVGKDVQPAFTIRDVTGDGQPELIYPSGIWLDIFGCTGKTNRYKLLAAATYGSAMSGVELLSITDINLDGLPELVVYFDGCLNSRCPAVFVYEWNGSEFENLIADAGATDGCARLSVAPFDAQLRDIDGNGTQELILQNDGKPWPDFDFPYRQETRICMWNGQALVLYKSDFDAPYYRFQAIQDGDRAFQAGDYARAASFYRQAISDDRLQWYSDARKSYDFAVYRTNFFSSLREATPTMDPSMLPDPNEYPNLAAYAHYRLMLLSLVQNDTPAALTEYKSLETSFPIGQPGGYFTGVATAFWQEYQRTRDFRSACTQAVAIAKANPEPLRYLGDDAHGVQSLLYSPDSICPVK